MKRSHGFGLVASLLSLMALGMACQPGGNLGPTSAAESPSFVDADGGVDYGALISVYGAPNENLIFNPRSLDVNTTPSATTVKASEGQLLFSGADGAWVADRLVGDILYCNVCGGNPQETFLRRVVAITQVNGDYQVQTVDAALSELIWWGWLHGDFAFDPDDPSTMSPASSGALTTLQTPFDESDSDNQLPNDHNWGNHQETPQFSYQGGTWGVQVPLSYSGSISFTPKNSGDVKLDMAFGWLSVNLFRFEVIDNPSLGMNVKIKAALGGGYSHEPLELCNKEWFFGPWLWGPVPVALGIQHKCFWTTNISGTLEVHATATAGLNLDDGVLYTPDAGFSLIAKNSAYVSDRSCDALNNGEVHTGPQEQIQANLLFFLVAGPSAGVVVFPNVWANLNNGCGNWGFNVLLSGTIGVATESLKVGGRELIPSRDAQLQIPVFSQNFPSADGTPINGPGCVCVVNQTACTMGGMACCNSTDTCTHLRSGNTPDAGNTCCVPDGNLDPSGEPGGMGSPGSQCCSKVSYTDDGDLRCGHAPDAGPTQDAGTVRDGGSVPDAGMRPDSGGTCAPTGSLCSGGESCCYAAAQCTSDGVNTVCCVPTGALPDQGDPTTCCMGNGVGANGECL